MARPASSKVCTLIVVLSSLLMRGGWAQEVDQFVSPVSNPTLFEDPRISTEVRPIFAYHEISDQFVSSGGNAKIGAVQLRLGVTDRLGFIATKDGYVWLEPDKALLRKNGWANIAFGLKYNFLRMDDLGLVATGGLRYETASGDKDVFQGRGDGLLNPFLSAGWSHDGLHLLGYTGPRLPISGNDTTFWDTSLHVDYRMGRFYPLIEVNWVHALDGGRRLPIDQEGFDFFNLGARNAAGRGVVTQAYGFRYRLVENAAWFDRVGGVDFGAAYETPLTDREDLFAWRVTTDLVFWLR
ncbi:MAG: hypothetical protein KatS3mg077_0189 [Candidatus Binatia bacterium]|nr:MAG: hypothetical protein KatS3mg077_0189 [Candidatus Binatia bacterium]